MGFKRLFGIGDPDEAIEVDTQVFGPVYPGGDVKGEVLLRGGARDTPVDGIYLRFTVRCTRYDGEERDYEFDSCVARPSDFTLHKGEEQRLTFSERLSWEVPVSELGGRALGVVLSVKSKFRRDWNDDGTEVDNDLLHMSALPLQEAVLDAFAEEGYYCDSAYVVDSYIPGVEQHRGFYQTFVLTDRSPGPRRPEQLEVVFHTNVVGALVHVRRAAPEVRSWDKKPPVRRFAAAHHEVGHVDWRPRVRKVLEELVLLDEL
ncbi:sporulation protein [Streptomyces naphthomycinicus]|uniref:sporulation protein n=1 Tax=Streptomyces naphthomycinicus TaxID=2872625 RepID=UPI001CEC5831|nr:sporulation protein [Streptomyces sp. TML10]